MATQKIRKPLIRYAGSAAETSIGSKPIGSELNYRVYSRIRSCQAWFRYPPAAKSLTFSQPAIRSFIGFRIPSMTSTTAIATASTRVLIRRLPTDLISRQIFMRD